MSRRASLPQVTGDTDAFRPSRQRPVRVRARTLAADAHFEPHSHAWSQLAYCASGIMQVTAEQHVAAGDEIAHADIESLGVPLPHPQTGDKRLRALCESVLRTPSKRETLADCAAEVGASERTMARLFRDELATTYQQWREQAILAHALPLLARGVPVSHVAASSGYASDSAFTAMFKAAMGAPPSRFRSA